MKRWMLVAMMMGSAAAASAQTGTPLSKLRWDMQAATLAEANSYTYKQYADGAVLGTTLQGVVCVNSSLPTVQPYSCDTLFTAFTPGVHTLQVSASNVAGESNKSVVLSFTFVVIPATPQNPRIVFNLLTGEMHVG